MLDKRAQSILFDTYWSSAGWRQSLSISSDDLAYAKQAGLMFDPVLLSHDEVIVRAVAAAHRINKRQVADAFLASLSTRRLDLRSGIGSFAVLRFLPDHAVVPGAKQCAICGAYETRGEPADLNVLSFERLKWGGVRHDQPLYAALDLELLAKANIPAPHENDVRIFREILHTIESVPPSTTSANLERHLTKHIKSNKAERDVLIDILGVCGVLETMAHPGYLHGFVPYARRELPTRRFVDMAYPVCWWNGAAGVNKEAISEFFGHVM